MNDKEYEPIRAANGAPLGLSVFDLLDHSDRTLLYGYTCDRDTWHAYLLGGEIHRHIYKFNEETISHVNYGETVSAAHDIIPDKRLYPAACDAETCRVLIGRGFYLPFTMFEDRGSRKFYGAVFTESTP